MTGTIERWSRRVAVLSLLASAAFFAWWAMSAVPAWPASLPFFGGLVAVWTLGAVGVHRQRTWGPGFAVGLSAISVVTLLPLGLQAPFAGFMLAQVVLITALTLRAFARQDVGWRHTGLSFAVGLGAPWLLLVGLLPGLGCTGSLIGMSALALGGAGAFAAFRGRTWGLFALVASIPLLIAVPEARLGCSVAPHDRAGELAALALGLATLPWAWPVARRLLSGR